MHILHSLFNELKKEFIWSRKGKERGILFIYTLLAIICRYKKETILYIYVIPQNTMERSLVKDVAYDT